MIEKILERLEELENIDICSSSECGSGNCDDCIQRNLVKKAMKIVQEVAKEYEDKANEAREDFMEIVYSELEEDTNNNRANRIIDAFDTYAPYQKGE